MNQLLKRLIFKMVGINEQMIENFRLNMGAIYKPMIFNLNQHIYGFVMIVNIYNMYRKIEFI